MDDESKKSLLAYTPMLHARLFKEQAKVRDQHFQPINGSLESTEKSDLPLYLDGNPATDRPLFVQFCANKADDLLEAAKYVAPYCDAVDLNLGCPQGIARTGKYGAFLQEDWQTIYALINRLHHELAVPVTAKIRILHTKEKTLEYAKMILSAGASILTVHGRRREQKAQNMGVADWAMIRYLRDNLPTETVIFANGNILNHSDIQPCLKATGADAVMSAEGNLSDPTIFAKPHLTHRDEREYWRGSNGMEGYRIDGVIRRYMDIIYNHVLDRDPPQRLPLFMSSDTCSAGGSTTAMAVPNGPDCQDISCQERRRDFQSSPNLRFMQGHLFQLLRPMLATHTDIRNALSQTRLGDMPAFEKVLQMVEDATRRALQREAEDTKMREQVLDHTLEEPSQAIGDDPLRSASSQALSSYKRPWWVCQPHIRPLPAKPSKVDPSTSRGQAMKELEKQDKQEADISKNIYMSALVQRSDEAPSSDGASAPQCDLELPKEALVCG